MGKINNARWMEQFEVLKGFVYEHGRFPQVHSGDAAEAEIGLWLHNQVVAFRTGTMYQERAALLDGFHPLWRGGRHERAEGAGALMALSHWKKNVPAGETAIDAVLDGEDLYGCLKAGVWSCEAYLREYQEKPNGNGVLEKVFQFLYPRFDLGCVRLLEDVFEGNDVMAMLEISGYRSAADMRDKVNTVLGELKQQQQMVLELRYGLNGYAQHMLREAGDVLGVTPERIRQVGNLAIRKLQRPQFSKRLMDGYSSQEIAAARDADFRREVAGLGLEAFQDLPVESLNLSDNACWSLKMLGASRVGNFLDKVDTLAEDPLWYFRYFAGMSVSADEVLCQLQKCESAMAEFSDKVRGFREEVPLEAFRKVPIEALGLAPRTLALAADAGFWCVGDVLDKADFRGHQPFAFLQTEYGFGRACCIEVRFKLERAAKQLLMLPERGYAQCRHILIEDMDLSVRSYRCLKRAGYRCVGDVMDKADFGSAEPYGFLFQIRNLGKKSYDEIVCKIREYERTLPKEKSFGAQKALGDVLGNAIARSGEIGVSKESVRDFVNL